MHCGMLICDMISHTVTAVALLRRPAIHTTLTLAAEASQAEVLENVYAFQRRSAVPHPRVSPSVAYVMGESRGWKVRYSWAGRLARRSDLRSDSPWRRYSVHPQRAERCRSSRRRNTHLPVGSYA
eukprot:1071793-Prymnesium_polylepis.1